MNNETLLSTDETTANEIINEEIRLEAHELKPNKPKRKSMSSKNGHLKQTSKHRSTCLSGNDNSSNNNSNNTRFKSCCTYNNTTSTSSSQNIQIITATKGGGKIQLY